MTHVLGVSAFYHDAAAALVAGGEIAAAAQEERFTRKRHDPRFPDNAIRFCLEMLDEQPLAAVAFYEDPVLTFDRIFKNAVEMAPDGSETWPAAAKSQFSRKLQVGDRLRALLPNAAETPVLAVEHHVSHAASAFYPSPFEEAAILVVDGVGEWATTTLASGKGTEIKQLRQIRYPHSLGLFYSAFCQFCGFKVNSGEYKLMGLAPYGEPRFANVIRDRLIDIKPDGSFRLDTAHFGYLTSKNACGPKFAELFGIPARELDSDLTQAHMDLAASAQTVLEEAMLGLARFALKETGSSHLCLAGGVALNCVANGKIAKQIEGLADLWIQPASGDAGGALGAALHVAHTRFDAQRHAAISAGRDSQKGSFLGPDFSDRQIRTALEQAGVVFHHIESTEEQNRQIASHLAAGRIVGRFTGAMEFGPRALGNRSILADARRDDGQAHINLRIKFRESWRPFAAIVLDDHAGAFFDLPADSPYMLLVGQVQPEHHVKPETSRARGDLMDILNRKRSTIPAVTHVDHSVRIQSVARWQNPGLHGLLSAFHAETDCPILVNTSFNVRGEPIVCTPQDAIECFLNTGIDILSIGDYVVHKHEQPEDLRAREGSIAYEPD
ncbi:MAG: carbamoyltransferase N-terminal domain-containing protein [Pseudomonadota bacterium]